MLVVKVRNAVQGAHSNTGPCLFLMLLGSTSCFSAWVSFTHDSVLSLWQALALALPSLL